MGVAEGKMVGWHHRLNGHEFEQALGDGERQETLACCSPQGHKEPDTTETEQQQGPPWSENEIPHGVN